MPGAVAMTKSSTADLAARVAAHLQACAHPDARVVGFAPLSGGACQELFSVEVEGLAGHVAAAPADGPWRLALRADAAQSLPGSVPRRVEFPVIQAAVRAGVPTPAARWFGAGVLRPGAGAYFLDWVSGEALGGRVVRHPRFESARARLPEQLARALAAIHTVTPATDPGAPGPGPRRRRRGRALAAPSLPRCPPRAPARAGAGLRLAPPEPAGVGPDHAHPR